MGEVVENALDAGCMNHDAGIRQRDVWYGSVRPRAWDDRALNAPQHSLQ
jgi:hypothetical protein